MSSHAPYDRARLIARLPRGLVGAVGHVGSRTGLGPRRLDADTLMAAALRRVGRKEFSDTSFVEPLTQLLHAYDEEADLSLFGRYAARFDVLRYLDNLLLMEAAEERDPQIVSRPVTRPIFITGLPRSSSTFLHTLLGQDPANAVPRCWELMYPHELPTRFPQPDLRRARVAGLLRFFRYLSPELDGLHPLEADAPQECTEITAQVFQSLRFNTTHRVPSYQNWLEAHGHYNAFRFHRRFLQHLGAHMQGRRWILKYPDHVFALDAIDAVYPDAQIIFLHRDPSRAIISLAKLTEALRRPFARHVDREAIGRQVAARWTEGATRMVAAASRPRTSAILHLHYRDVVSAPIESVASLYRHCGLTFSEEAKRRMRTYLERMPRGGYRRHRYNFAEFGLDPQVLSRSFAEYRDVFGIAPESGTFAWGAVQSAV